jgi:hypothetical protein
VEVLSTETRQSDWAQVWIDILTIENTVVDQDPSNRYRRQQSSAGHEPLKPIPASASSTPAAETAAAFGSLHPRPVELLRESRECLAA